MRTTVTLDPDVVAALRAVVAERRVSFKEAINASVRAGIAAGRRGEPFQVMRRPLGLRAGVDLDRALTLVAELSDDEVVRKLERRK